MHPLLFTIFGWPVYSYTFFAVLVFFVNLTYALAEGRRIGVDVNRLLDLALLMFITSLLGARLFFIILNYEHFLSDPMDVLRIWRGGLVFYGGMILTVIAALSYIKYFKMNMGQMVDLLAPTAMLSQIFGRLGCLLNGCCYGRIAPDLAWGIKYPSYHQVLGLLNVKVHPSPLYASAAALVIFIILIVISRKKAFQGQVFWSMTLLYSIARFILEFFRGDPRGHIEWLNLSTSQVLSIPIALASLAVLLVLWKRTRRLESSGEVS